MKTNRFSETTSFSHQVKTETLNVTVKALSFSEVAEVAGEFLQLAAAAQSGGNLNMVQALDKVLQVASETKDDKGESVPFGDLPIDLVGRIAEQAVQLNFTPAKLSSWLSVTSQIKTLLAKAG